MAKFRPNSKSHPTGGSFFSCFGFSGEAKKSSKDGILRRRRISGRWLSFSSDTSSVAVQPTGLLVLPISAGQDTAAPVPEIESSQFQKPKEEEDQIGCDVASKEEDTCQDPLPVMSSSSRNKRAAGFSRSVSLPAPAKKEMKTAGRKKNRGSYGGGLYIAALTLVVMIVWGKICAIVLVSCFLYSFPLLRYSGDRKILSDQLERESKSNDVVDDDDDLEEDRMKKRQIVMNGFLQRNRRRSSFANC
ncbi:uncharacterized protein LOC124935484 [Impatiens glandulifera]|uniref:uncharacterized protein LOC124935484 n=1 Tax=Impatiens glandulifera TaxID=253017 RepID=UPI001FB0B39D|nr:uncharacterized protein LOC124935484 [Impatiens glandulifera]